MPLLRYMLVLAAWGLTACNSDDGSELRDVQVQDGGAVDAQLALDGHTDLGMDATNSVDAVRDGSEASDAARSSGDGSLVACGPIYASGDVILDLGHTGPTLLRMSSDRLLSVSASRWLLWDLQTGAHVADGPAILADSVQIAGNVFVIATSSAREVRDLHDGHLLGTIPVSTGHFGLASDASYVWTGTTTELDVWSPSGSMLFSKSGNYGPASSMLVHKLRTVAATPGRLSIALGPVAGAIEQIAIPSGTSTSLPYLGTFASWFADYSHFATFSGSAVRFYGPDAVQQAIIDLTSESFLVGTGMYYWTTQHDQTASEQQLRLHVIGEARPPVVIASHFYINLNDPDIFAMNGALGVLDRSAGKLQIFEYDDSGVVTSDATVPTAFIEQFAGLDSSNWLTSDRNGGIFGEIGGQPRSFGCGAALDVALADNGAWAVAVDANQVITGTLQDRTSYRVIAERAGQLALTPDGKTLITRASDDYSASVLLDRSVDVRNVETGAIVFHAPSRDDPSNRAAPYIVEFSLDSSGTRLALVTCTPTNSANWSCDYAFSDLNGGGSNFVLHAAAASNMQNKYNFANPYLSPSGARIALSTELGLTESDSFNIYEGSVLLGAASGDPVAWLGEDRVLVMNYYFAGHPPSSHYGSATIVDHTGAVVAMPPLPDVTGGRVSPDGTRIYLGANIYDVQSGAVVWTLPQGFDYVARYNQTSVVYTSGNALKITTHP